MAYPIIEKADARDTVDTLWTDSKWHGEPIKTEHKITCAWGCGCCITVEPLTVMRLLEHIERLEDGLTTARELLDAFGVCGAPAEAKA